MNISDATYKWVDQWNFVPGSIFEKLAEHDENVRFYDSEALSLLASPEFECSECGQRSDSETFVCENCGCNEWAMARPQYAFPCGWGTLFNPNERMDDEWIRENLQVVTGCGFFVFDSEDYGVLLGIDGGGYDFYDDHWIPLYHARGLRWHDEES